MLLDEQALFSDQQAITATAASTNYINLGTPATPPGSPAALKRDIGGGNDIPILVQVTEVFNNLTTLQVDVEVDDNSSFSSPKVTASTGAVALASLVAGKKLSISVVPPGTDEQHMRLKYTVVGTAPTTGKVTAGIVAGVQTNG